jgi:hypothetical protein
LVVAQNEVLLLAVSWSFTARFMASFMAFFMAMSLGLQSW